ncbi:unnamed protein product [Rotaria sordida]|uniref:B box-type domain-containing protein n=1 Tax=Rotaria sordida TaxID=392033 RepID=A0A814AV59_9BILA|nr:unnamed protein product [Rotaria sordida]
MTANPKALSIVAKCALCSIKTELFICPHCDEVICQTCVNKHQSQLNETLKEHWLKCKTKFHNLCQLSNTCDKDFVLVENEMSRIRQIIEQQYLDVVESIESEKNTLLIKLEDYIKSITSNVKHKDLQQLFNSINQRLEDVFQNSNTAYNADDFLLEIEHFNMQISNRLTHIQSSSFKYPYLNPSKPVIISDIFGELQWNSKPMSNRNLSRPLFITTSGHGSIHTSDELQDESLSVSEEDSIPVPVMRRQKQWSIDACGVPHFLCILSKKNYLLFACDKYGCIDLYQLDGTDPSNTPRHLRQFDLFPGNNTNQKAQIIEAFTVYTPFIVVSAHLSDQTDTSSVYFFDHRGSQQADTCLQNFPVRQLSADPSFKCLWGVDRHQHTIYYNQLPMNVSQIQLSIEHRADFIKFGRDFEPIRITQNQTSIAVVERNSQSVHIFDKQTKEQIDEIQNLLRTEGSFRLWNVLLRDNNSMVLKLDEDLPPYSRPQTIHHLIVELDSKGMPISQIERTAVYGLAIGPNQEILLGCCFDDKTLILICPKCKKLHQYNSREEFENRCMPDGFLASMVTQFKRNQSRLSGLKFRPTSVNSQMSITYGFLQVSTPVRMLSQNINSNYDQSYSEHSTPSIFNQQRSSSVLSQSINRLLIAKCQSCNIKGELIVCTHCDNVICIKCVDEHQNIINNDIKDEWNLCKIKFQTLHEQSNCFETDLEECMCKAHQLQILINEQSDKLIQTINSYKNAYIDLIEKHRRTYKQFFAHEQVIDEYESIDKRINDLLRSSDITAEKISDFSFEIEHLEGRLDNFNKLLNLHGLKFPVLTLPEKIDISLLLGTLKFIPLDSYSSQLSNIYNNLQLESEYDDNIFIETNLNKSTINNQQLSPLPIPIVSKKKLLWQLDYKSVPYYIRTYNNQLFVCDKYGHISIYEFNKLNDYRQKPTFIREIILFNDHPISTVTTDDQTIIDSFVVSKLWIIVLKRKKTELYGIIYLFTHDGKLIPNGKYLHNYPSRELTIDIETNILWSLDQQQLCLYYYQLPDQIEYSNKIENYFQNRYLHVQFPKTFIPKHISLNKNVLAVLDKKRQAVHVYNKQTRQELYEHVSNYNNTTYFCWDMALFSDNSLLIKLDETNSLKTNSSKHIYLQLDTTNQHHVIGMIEEIDAYGMIITSTDEIFIGVRINKQGIIKCYA